MQQKSNPKNFIEISKSAFLRNARYFKKNAGKMTRVAFVIKSNAYGHGLMEVAGIIAKEADWFCVDCIEEALELRKKFSNRILILGFLPPDRIAEAVYQDISFTVYDMHHLKEIVLLKNKKPAKIHFKIESGMHRQGVEVKDLNGMLEFIKDNKGLILEGVSTHFATADYPAGKKYILLQKENFLSSVSQIKKFFPEVLVHASATAACLNYPDCRFDMVRIGLGLYGLYENKNLTPALTWKSIVAQVKYCEKGEFVSYGATWIAKRRTRIAVIPVGYADGFDRGLGNKGSVVINKMLCKVLGRVCMNMFMVDVSRVSSVKEGDGVIIIGKAMGIRARDIAKRTETITYEVVARLNPLTPRKIIR